MKPRCPYLNCKSHLNTDPNFGQIILKGFYHRASDSRFIRRYQCKICHRKFSRATISLTRYQKKRRITPHLKRLIVSGVSQRRAAMLLGVNRKTVVRRFRYLAIEGALAQEKFLQSIPKSSLHEIQFDDLETSEHTKCKPLSVALAVEPKSRKILGFQVSQMPAKGLLAEISRKKYGHRKDERNKGWAKLMQTLKSIVNEKACFVSDENPHYPKHIKAHFKECTHIAILGGRGAITGQGELKKKKFDPMFSLNHTCAMLRANLNRLFRRTWCTTKTRQGLMDHLSIYVDYHNQVLTAARPELGASLVVVE